MIRLGKGVCVVTGANRGIGRAVARSLAASGLRVVMGCRSLAKGREARDAIREATGNGQVQIRRLDLASQASIRQFVEEVVGEHSRLDLLINNAAAIPSERTITEDELEMQLAVNHLGPFLLTNLLLRAYATGWDTRIVNVSSNAHYRGRIDFDDLQSEHRYEPRRVYRATKLANLTFTLTLARRLVKSRVSVNAVRPGTIDTPLLGAYLGALRPLRRVLAGPARGAAPIVRVGVSPGLAGMTGRYFDRFRARAPARVALDPRVQERLWRVSADLTGLR